MKQCDMKIACDAIKKIDNLQDLNVVIRQLKLTQKTLRAQQAVEAKATFSVGEVVNIRLKDGGTLKGTINKLNRTRAICDISGKSYNVPFSLMEVV